MSRFADTSIYKLELEVNGIRIYTMLDAKHYHTSRIVQWHSQNIYATAGADKSIIQSIADEMIKLCNSDKPVSSFRTDIGLLAQNLKYRTQYPVDELCALRIGAILSFMETETESEDPDRCLHFWIDKKVKLAQENPDLYTFFLSWGVANQPEYNGAIGTSQDLDYLITRRQILATMIPDSMKQSLTL